MDVSFITPRIATGAAFGASDVDALVAAGITDIIDCAFEDTQDIALLAAHPSIAVLLNGTADDGTVKPPEWFAKGISFALDALSHPHRRLLCHCVGGVNRGPSMCYAVLRSLGLTSTVSSTMIRSARPVTNGGLRYMADADDAIAILGYQ